MSLICQVYCVCENLPHCVIRSQTRKVRMGLCVSALKTPPIVCRVPSAAEYSKAFHFKYCWYRTLDNNRPTTLNGWVLIENKLISYKLLFLGHRNLIKKITQTAVINIVFKRIFMRT